jgi:hypothetical protein
MGVHDSMKRGQLAVAVAVAAVAAAGLAGILAVVNVLSILGEAQPHALPSRPIDTEGAAGRGRGAATPSAVARVTVEADARGLRRAALPSADASVPRAPEAERFEAPSGSPAIEVDGGAPSLRGSFDANFGVRWGQAGLCPQQDAAAVLARRFAALAGFRTIVVGGTDLRVAPEIPSMKVDQVAAMLDRGRARTSQILDWDPSAPHPPAILYRDDEQLRRTSCINQGAIGYYDGTIHISADPKHAVWHLEETVVHEYVHHALNSLGVRAPMWFHEGLAMHAARERWFLDPRLGLVHWLEAEHLPFAALVAAFPHTADERFAAATYYQGYKMVEFLEHQGVTARTLAREIGAKRVTAEAAFVHAAGLATVDLEPAWQAFVAPGAGH